MALTPENVVVAGTGAVYVAPEGTPLPTDLAALAAPWLELGYVGEDGVTFTLSREQEDVNAWQASEPVRSLITAEPKQVAFELLEFGTPETVELALRGGSIAVAAGVATYTPPDPGARDTRALVIDAVDGDETFRFAFANVSLQGDVEWSLTKSDATRLPLELGILAGGWTILTDHPAWVAAGGALVAGGSRPNADEVVAALPTMSDAELVALEADDRKTVQAALKSERERRAAVGA